MGQLEREKGSVRGDDGTQSAAHWQRPEEPTVSNPCQWGYYECQWHWQASGPGTGSELNFTLRSFLLTWSQEGTLFPAAAGHSLS